MTHSLERYLSYSEGLANYAIAFKNIGKKLKK